MPTTKVNQLRHELRELIVSGSLRQGERLTVRELAQRFSVSPTPVREALRMLEGEGLVTITPNAQVEVSSFSTAEVEEAFFIRSHLEGLATQLSVGYLTDEAFEDLDRLMAAMTDAAERQDAAVYAVLNRQFHHRIYDFCPYRSLIRLIDDLWVKGLKFKVLFRFAPARMTESIQEHAAMLAAVRAGKADEAGQLALKHQASAGQVLIDYVTLIDDRPAPGDAAHVPSPLDILAAHPSLADESTTPARHTRPAHSAKGRGK